MSAEDKYHPEKKQCAYSVSMVIRGPKKPIAWQVKKTFSEHVVDLSRGHREGCREAIKDELWRMFETAILEIEK